MVNPRQRICNAISGLSGSCTLSEVEEVLDPMFREYTSIGEVGTGITPLLLACDKGSVILLQYLKSQHETSQWASECIGEPLHRSPDEKNTPLHHAAMVGCVEAISFLCDMGVSPLDLGSARNSHGDTPLMMAATSGHLEFCKIWHEKCGRISTLSADSILRTWELKNNSGDSCLSLACGHGCVPVVEFLISSDCKVSIDSGVIEKCQALLDRMDVSLRRNPSLVHQRADMVENVRLCIGIMQAKADQEAEQAAQELMKLETIEAVSSSKSRSSRKHKPRLRKLQRHSNVPIPSTCIDASSVSEDIPSTKQEHGSIHLTTLHDGSKAVRVDGSMLQVPSPLVAVQRTSLSVDDMFRDRFKQGRISSEVDFTMRALCLDMSMLLYTPHRMAIDLSPSQLDAVEDILERQLKGIHEARRIQGRLHASSTPQEGESQYTIHK